MQLHAGYNFSMGVFSRGDLYIWGYGSTLVSESQLHRKILDHKVTVEEYVRSKYGKDTQLSTGIT